MWDFVMDKVALGQVFSEYFGFPYQSSFHQFLHNHPQLSPEAGTIGQGWPQCQKPHKPNKKKVALGQDFSDYFGFPCPIFIPPISRQSPLPIIRGWYNRPEVATVPKLPRHKLK
jgi:hypothetical protein